MQDHVIDAVFNTFVDTDIADTIAVIKRLVLGTENFFEAARLAAADEFLGDVGDAVNTGIRRPSDIDGPFRNCVGILPRATGQR